MDTGPGARGVGIARPERGEGSCEGALRNAGHRDTGGDRPSRPAGHPAGHQQQHGRPDRPGAQPALVGGEPVRVGAPQRAAGPAARSPCTNTATTASRRRTATSGRSCPSPPTWTASRRSCSRLTTFGGDEYCGTVIQAALDQLRWSRSPADLKAVFIAGNEPFSQGPVDFRRVSARALAQGVLVNTIHCGTREEAASRPAGAKGRGWPTARSARSTRAARSHTSPRPRTTRSRGWAWS